MLQIDITYYGKRVAHGTIADSDDKKDYIHQLFVNGKQVSLGKVDKFDKQGKNIWYLLYIILRKVFTED